MEFGLVGLWLATFLLLGLLARPLAAWLLPDLDHDAFAIPLGLAVVGVVGHLVGAVAFGWPALLAGLAVLVVAAYRLGGLVPFDRRRLAEVAAVFAGAFLFMVAVRSFEPAAASLPVAIGEKFLDFGLLRTLLRTPRLPPEDLWFAGEAVRYHYGGHMLAALLATLTGTPARYAYNLALAGFFATLVVAAYGLAGSIAERYAVSRRRAAAFGAFFVGLAGNLDTLARVVVWLLPSGAASWLATGLGYDPSVLQWHPTAFFYFDASRVFPIDPTVANSYKAATEFPLFAWLNGDLHAHMMSQPFMLLVAAVLLAYWRTDDPRRRLGLLLGALPPLVGFLGLVNIWSVPTAGGLVLLAVAFAPGRSLLDSVVEPRDRWFVEEGRRWVLAAAAAVVVLGLSVVWTLPYWLDVVLVGPGRTLALWGKWTGLGGLLIVNGAFLAVLGLYLVGGLAVASARPERGLAAWLGLLGASILLGAPAWGLVFPLAIGAWWLLRSRPRLPTDGAVGFELVLVLAGAGLLLLVELVTIKGDRFNTVFKYYAHIWLFWSVASGVALARLSTGWPGAAARVPLPAWGTVGRVLAAAVVVSTSLYGAFALPALAHNPGPAVAAEGPTLDATAFVDVSYPAEAPAIHWLDARPGRPVIVTAVPAGYWWRPARGDGSSAASSLTGLPTVLGWFHEAQYRGTGPYERRLQDVRTIYTGAPSSQRALLKRYDVSYVYVGPAERATFSRITVANLDAVTVARRWDQVTIYRVNQSAL